MNLTNFTENIVKGINNPDCAFFVGTTTGTFFTSALIIKIILASALIWFGFRILAEKIISPLIDYIAKKINKK